VVTAAAAVGVAADDDLLFAEELGVFLAFLGYRKNGCIYMYMTLYMTGELDHSLLQHWM
jgi:hypothetical protein